MPAAIVIAAFALAQLALAGGMQPQEQPQPIGKIAKVLGQVEIRRAANPSENRQGAGETVVATERMSLFLGDAVMTNIGGRLRFSFSNGTIVNLAPQSYIRIIEYNARTGRTRIELLYGKLRATVVRDTMFEVHTQTGVVSSHGGHVYVDASNPTSTTVSNLSDPASSNSVQMKDFPDDTAAVKPGESRATGGAPHATTEEELGVIRQPPSNGSTNR